MTSAAEAPANHTPRAKRWSFRPLRRRPLLFGPPPGALCDLATHLRLGAALPRDTDDDLPRRDSASGIQAGSRCVQIVKLAQQPAAMPSPKAVATPAVDGDSRESTRRVCRVGSSAKADDGCTHVGHIGAFWLASATGEACRMLLVPTLSNALTIASSS